MTALWARHGIEALAVAGFRRGTRMAAHRVVRFVLMTGLILHW